MPVSTLLKAATLTEVGDALVTPPKGRKALFVLAGYGSALRTNYSLAEPEDFGVRIFVHGEERRYELESFDFRVFPKAGTATVDMSKAFCYRLDTSAHDYFRIFLIAREEKYAAEFESQLTPITFEAATLSKDWRLENALEWCVTERRVEAGELQPETGVKMPDKLRWRMRKPVFRSSDHRVLYQWELCSLIDGPYERPLITCVTDNEGTVTRHADLVPIRLLFAGGRAAAGQPPGPAPAQVPSPAAAAGNRPAPATPAPAAAPAKPAARPMPPPKVVPDARRKALEERMRAAGEAEMAKIRKLFEMPD